MARQLKKSELRSIRDQLVRKQKGKCAICEQPFTGRDDAVVDHCHDTGYIRGVLHRSCNQAEGKVKVKAMRSHAGVAAYTYLIGLGKYLEQHSTPQYKHIHPNHMTAEQKRLERNKKAREARARRKAER